MRDPKLPSIPDAHLARTIVNHGIEDELTVRIPSFATAQQSDTVTVFSHNTLDFYFLPIHIIVGNVCSSFASCADCTLAFGCGWCAASSTCQELDESTCTDALAPWSGGCAGFCASHDASCSDCAVQYGCGWCATAQGTRCLEMGANYSQPHGASCPYADWTTRPTECSP